MLRPELDERGVAVGLVGAKLLQHRAGEAVEVAERGGSLWLDVRQRLPGLLGLALADELAVLHPHLAVGAAVVEERRAEAGIGVAKGDLVEGQAGGRDDRLGDLVKRLAGLAEAPRQRLQSLPGAEPAIG